MTATAPVPAPVLPRVLLVDDDARVREALHRSLCNKFAVVDAASGAAALTTLEKDPGFAVIISDLRMPSMNGVTFLSRSREYAPDAMRVLLTGYADLDTVVDAVKESRVYQILRKPCHPTVLSNALLGAVEQHERVTADRKIVEEAKRAGIRAMSELLALANPAMFARAKRVGDVATALACRLDVPDPGSIQTAAVLWHVGCLALPSVLVNKIVRGLALSDEEQGSVDGLPATALRLIASMPGLDAIRELLGALPLTGVRAPRGAQVLWAALELESLEGCRFSEKELYDTLQVILRGCDDEILEELRNLRGADGATVQVRDVLLIDIATGMRFATDVVNQAGLLLIPRGQEVTLPLLERVRTHWSDFARTETMRMIVREVRPRTPVPPASESVSEPAIEIDDVAGVEPTAVLVGGG